MAIAPAAIKAFFSRKRKNSERAKRFSKKALRKKIAKLDPQPDFVFEPYDHQKVCFLLAQKYPSYAFLLDMGLGKTKLVLDIFCYEQKLGRCKRALVLVEAAVHTTLWEEEARIHAPHLRVVGLDEKMTHQERLDAINSEADVVVATYQGWASLVTKSVPDTKNPKKNVWALDPKKARLLEKNFDFSAFDESTCVGNHQSIWYKAAARVAKAVKSLYLLTGTGFSTDPIKLWPQFKLVDGGWTLGETLGLFKAAFYREVRRPWLKWPDHEFDRSKTVDLHRMMKHSSIRYTEDECLDLPSMVGGIDDLMIRYCVLPKETWQYHDKLVEARKAGRGNVDVMEHTYTRLRMLSSGFLPVADHEGGKHVIVFKDNPKVDVLNALLDEIPKDEKVIIAYHYMGTGDILEAAMKKRKEKFAVIAGKTKKAGAELLKFKNDPKCRILIGSKSAAKGLNLQFSRRIIFFESPDDLDIRRQWERRIKRPGQTRRMYVYDIVVKGSIDEQLLPRLKNYKRTADAIMDGKITLTTMMS